jgi:hypothetical protein
MKPPCEVIVKDLLPYLRAFLAKELVREHKFKRIRVARELALTRAAVTQYVKKLRGKESKFFKEFDFIVPDLRRLAREVAKGARREQIIAGMCKICRKVRASKEFCDYHRKMLMLSKCRVCLR